MREPILITGAARSGTSMVAGVVDWCGAFGGVTSPPNPNNRKGMFENARVRNTIVKPFLGRIGVDMMGQSPLPKIDDLQRLVEEKMPAITSWRRRVEEIFKSEGYSGGPWYYKGAKMCLMWPIWKHAFPRARWLIVRRDPEDIVRSCLHTGFMRAFRTKQGWGWWVAQHEQRFIEMREADMDIVAEIWPQRMIDRDLTEIKEAVITLGLVWKQKAVTDFIAPELWKSR